MILFNKAFITEKEEYYAISSLKSRKISGDGYWTKQASLILENLYHSKVLLTTSCTDALEMCALLLNINEGDEIIIPSYTFVSTALAFLVHGAKIVFADSELNRPHLDMNNLPITNKTKAIVPVHYAGQGCDMDTLTKTITKTNIKIIEDNAQGILSKLNGQLLGTFGSLSTISFHDSKNIVCGEGGALIINDAQLIKRAEIIREKGTNRSQFFRGEIDKYNWVDIGSSYLLGDILAAVLTAQLENMNYAQEQRIKVWQKYMEELNILTNKCNIVLPDNDINNKGNAHIFYLICESLEQRTKFIEFMKNAGIMCVFHYISLHKSPYFKDKYEGPELKNSDRFTDCLVRLPLYADLTNDETNYIISKTKEFFGV